MREYKTLEAAAAAAGPTLFGRHWVSKAKAKTEDTREERRIQLQIAEEWLWKRDIVLNVVSAEALRAALKFEKDYLPVSKRPSSVGRNVGRCGA